MYLYYFFSTKYIRQDIAFKACDGNFVKGNIHVRPDYFNLYKIKLSGCRVRERGMCFQLGNITRFFLGKQRGAGPVARPRIGS